MNTEQNELFHHEKCLKDGLKKIIDLLQAMKEKVQKLCFGSSPLFLNFKKMENPNYFAIIPADVRYASIPDGAKLLYGEITALAKSE